MVAGKRCRILLEDGSESSAVVRGKLFADPDVQPVAGDLVLAEQNDAQWMIESVSPRTNEFVRQGLRKERQVLFANADRVLILASLNSPCTKEASIDRFLVAALRGGIHPVLVCSKTDLDRSRMRENELRDLYSAFDVGVFALSSETGDGIEALRTEISNGTSALVGNSGVGKSTLVNALIPGLDLKTREISEWSGKGTHTTTSAILVSFSPHFVGGSRGESANDSPPRFSGGAGGGSFLLDTPGMKSFVPYGITRDNLMELFPDLAEHSGQCKFSNCRHERDPGCAINFALERGEISASRLRSYHRLLSEM